MTGIATLILITPGLGVIYGMMRIINLAHGEFMMLGAYTAVTAVDAGVNIWVAMLVLPPLAVGLIGLVVERTVIRFLYGRMGSGSPRGSRPRWRMRWLTGSAVACCPDSVSSTAPRSDGDRDQHGWARCLARQCLRRAAMALGQYAEVYLRA